MTAEATRRVGEIDIVEWIAETCGQPREWRPYAVFTYRKRYCDVRVKSGEECGPCWPHGGSFYTLLGVGFRIAEEDVTHVRYYMNKED